MTDKHAIIVSGVRRSGKDTLITLLHGLDSRFERFSFADRLKEDLISLLGDQFNIDPFNCSEEQKELVRPILIAYGCAWREVNKNHWVELVIERAQFRQRVMSDMIVAVSDGRFTNEIKAFRDFYGKNLFHIDVSRTDGPPPTEEEERNFRQVQEMADYKLVWGNDSMSARIEKATMVYNWLLENGLPKNS